VKRISLRGIGHTLGALLDRYILRITVVALVAAFFFVFFAHRIIVTVPAGYRSVLWQRFGGTNVYRTYGEGTRFIWPWNAMTLYDIRYQTDDRKLVVVDSQGLRFDLQISTRYRLNANTLGQLHQLVGPNYMDVIIAPEVSSHIRSMVSKLTAEHVYSLLRPEIENHILQRLRTEIKIKRPDDKTTIDFVYVEDILLHDIALPPIVIAAIDEKIRQYHMVEEWKFRKTREEIEAERKGIEGKGIRNFQEAVGNRLTDQYLRWKAIEATLKLAESANAKTIIIGSGPQGLPVILGNEGVRSAFGPGGGPRADTPAAAQPARAGPDETKRTPSPGQAAAPTPPRAPAAPATGTSLPSTAPAAPASPEAKAVEPKALPAPRSGWLGGAVSQVLKYFGQ